MKKHLATAALAVALTFIGMPTWAQVVDGDDLQAAIDDAAAGQTITVAPGTYAPIVIDKEIHLAGAQAGVGACDRIATESVITGAGILIDLRSGSASSTIDGFLLDGTGGATNGLESTTGPIDNIRILNNLFTGIAGSSMFLNNSGNDVTVRGNRFDGSSKTGNGATVHLDTDGFDGFHFVDNCVVDAASGAGFFVDGNRNIGVSTSRAPLFSGNLFDNSVSNVGANLGSRAVEFATFRDNIFSNHAFDGIQGGMKGSVISGNTFTNNGRFGLALTSFGNTNLDRGAQSNVITKNCFIDNGATENGSGIFLSSTQAAGSISTNRINQNNFSGNNIGAVYGGIEIIDAENNWWGDASGPSGDGIGNGDQVDGMSGGGAIDFDPFLVAEVPGTPCSQSTAALDHFVCYKVDENSKFRDKVVTLEDQFGFQNKVKVKKAKMLCAPASKNGEPVFVPAAHLTCYDIKSDQKPKVDVLVTHQFGEYELEVKKAEMLCLPSSKEVLGSSRKGKKHDDD